MPGLILRLLASILMVIFLGYMIYEILIIVFRSIEVTANIFYGSICVYLIIGLMWGFVYYSLETIHPFSFTFENNGIVPTDFSQKGAPQLPIFMYYSFITLTTLGYGDVTPLTFPTQMISSAEAVVGQLYLTILVARLVGLHISQRN